MEGYVDIHSHILPCVDDGSQSVEETFAMLEIAYEEGIRTIIATPHYGRRNPDLNIKRCRDMVDTLNRYIIEKTAVEGSLKGLTVRMGNELFYSSGISADILSGKAASLADSEYVLIEFYDDADYATLLACAREMALTGCKAVFAHIERYRCLRGCPDRLAELRDAGVLFQLNADELTEVPVERDAGQAEEEREGRSFLDAFRWKRNTIVAGSVGVRDEMSSRMNAAWEYLLSGNADFIASDAHGDIFRRPVMAKAIGVVREVAGDETADRIIGNSISLVSTAR